MTATSTKPAQKKMAPQAAQAPSAVKQPEPINFELANQKYQGALFNIDEDKQTQDGPLMSGSVEVAKVRIPLSAFLEISEETGKRYLNLSLGGKDGVHYYGRLFRNDEKRSEKSPDYSGYFHILPVNPGDQYTDEEWAGAAKLQVYGRRTRNADDTVRIALDIVPMRSQEPIGDDELAY